MVVRCGGVVASKRKRLLAARCSNTNARKMKRMML